MLVKPLPIKTRSPASAEIACDVDDVAIQGHSRSSVVMK